jgi:hypothetical protein
MLNNWSKQTTFQDEAGTNAVWDNIEGWQTAVTGDDVCVLKYLIKT